MKKKIVKYNIAKNTPVITDDLLFPYANVRKISVPRSVGTIYNGAFFNKKSLVEVYFERESKLSKIPESCFSGCINLKKINLPEEILIIEKFAFKNCTSIKEIHLPKDITDIHPDAFYGWTDEQTIYTHLDIKKPITTKAKIILIKSEESIEKEEFDQNSEEKYFLVTAKCGHVGRHRYMPITFAIKANTRKEASDIVKNKPRVKRHHKDVILNNERVSYERYVEQIKVNYNDPYLKIKRKGEQNKIIDSIVHRLVPEKNYRRK